MIDISVKCKDCGNRFILKDELEYILSYCEGCRKLVVIYKINPAVLFKIGDSNTVFISSNEMSKCRRCGNYVSIRDRKDYFSFRCDNCGFGIVYKMKTHRGVGRFITSGEFSKDIYWTTGKRKADRKERDEKFKR